jgi:hypothetical protein
MTDQVVVQEWQPFFMTLAGASAALAGLVFVAMSLHPWPILNHPIMRARLRCRLWLSAGCRLGAHHADAGPHRACRQRLAHRRGGRGEPVHRLSTDPAAHRQHECRARRPGRSPHAGSVAGRRCRAAPAPVNIPLHSAGHHGWRGTLSPLLPVLDAGAAQCPEHSYR